MATAYTGMHAKRREPLGMTASCQASNKNTSPPSPSEDSTKKIRKPYTITKSRERWTQQEHDKFLEAIKLFDRDWKKIESFIGSKTVIQVRSHAQKYFMKVQKNGRNGHVPPPRPKGKATHSNSHKTFKNGQNLELLGSSYSENSSAAIPSHCTIPSQSSSYLLEPGYAFRNSIPVMRVPSSLLSSFSPANVSHMMADGNSPENHCGRWQTDKTTDTVNCGPPVRVMPDFAQVYAFISSIFDPNTRSHLEKLKEMDPIDVDAALLLIKNLAINLSSLKTEDHEKLLSLYVSKALQNQIPIIPTPSSLQMMLEWVATAKSILSVVH